MTRPDRQRRRWLPSSPDVVTKLRLVVLGMLCIETMSGFYDDAVDPDVAVTVLIVVQAVSALAAGAALLWRAHRLGLLFFLVTVLLAGISRPIGIDFLLVLLSFFLFGLRSRRYVAVAGAVGGALLSVAIGLRNERILEGTGWPAGLSLMGLCISGAVAGYLVRIALRAVERTLRRTRELQVEAAHIRRQERRRLSADLQLALDAGLRSMEHLTEVSMGATVLQLRNVLTRIDDMSRQLLVQTRVLLETLRPHQSKTQPAERGELHIQNHAARRWVVRTARALFMAIAILTIMLSNISAVSTWVAALAWLSASFALWRPAVGIISAGLCLMLVVVTVVAGGTPGRMDVLATAVLCIVISMSFAQWIGPLILAGVPFLVLVGFVEQDDATHALLHAYVGAVALLLGWSWQYLRARQSEALGELMRTEEQRDHVIDQEREALARELHDVVAHQLSITSMMIMASSASTDRNQLQQVVARLHANTTAARSELETLVEGLQLDASPSGPHVTPTRMASTLSRRLGDQGFEPHVNVDATSDDLEAAQMITVVRFMQEATTNVLRYAAAGTPCNFSIKVEPTAISAEVTSELSSTPRRSALSSGWGLRGLRERTDLLGGSFHAGPQQGRWVVSLQLPRQLAETQRRLHASSSAT